MPNARGMTETTGTSGAEPGARPEGGEPARQRGHRAGSGVAVVDRESGQASRRRSPEAGASVVAEPDTEVKPDLDHRGGGEIDWSPGDDERDGERDGDDDGAGVGQNLHRRLATRRLRSWRRWVPWVLAVAGIVGTAVFGHAWASQQAQLGQQAQVRTVASDFLLALTNFDAKNVDADFSRIQGYATGTFAKQSNRFFGSAIRTQLEAALASSRGQLRNLYIQSLSGNQASVYSVVDQTYVNDKMQSPSADVLQIVTDLSRIGSVWKVSDVTVLNNATGSSSAPAAGSAVGSTTAGG